SITNADSDTVNLPLTAKDSMGNAMTYGATNLPTGLAIDTTTGVISGTIDAGADAGSPYAVTVTATDNMNGNGTASQNFTWTVNPTTTVTVSLTNPGNQTNAEGDPVNTALAATDSASNALLYSATGLPPGLTVARDTGVISGTL